MHEGPQAFRWRLVGKTLPPVTATLRVGEATRAAIYRRADACGLLPLPDRFHRGSDRGHIHAFWLPEDADQDGLIDHVLLFSASGLPEKLIPVLAEGGELYLGKLGRCRLAPDWMGHRAPGALFGPAQHWVTTTPYVTPLSPLGRRGKLKRNPLSPEDQLHREIEKRGLSGLLAAAAVQSNTICAHHPIRPSEFVLRACRRRALPGAVGVGAELYFSEPIWGPLALGFGAHFGLGLFEPVDGFG